jgi:hypothetical protein
MMLDPWIIDEIRKREEERRRQSEGVQQQLPDEPAEGPPREPSGPGRKPDRGVAIVDYKV